MAHNTCIYDCNQYVSAYRSGFSIFIKLNLNPNKVPTVQRCIDRNLIKEDLSNICILGDNIDDMVIKDFKIPKNKSISLLRGMIPKNLEVYINKKLNIK